MGKIKNSHYKSVAYKINKMADNDQRVRKEMQKSGVWSNKIDKENTKELKRIINAYGWPTVDLVGKKANKNAWLLVQHADHDIKFQKRCLVLMKKVFKNDGKNIDKTNIAFLTDRVLVNEGKKQLFGTQFYKTKEGKLISRPISDIKNLDRRRAQYDLPPFDEFLKLARKYNLKLKKLKR